MEAYNQRPGDGLRPRLNAIGRTRAQSLCADWGSDKTHGRVAESLTRRLEPSRPRPRHLDRSQYTRTRPGESV